jgi:hypothetical protein
VFFEEFKITHSKLLKTAKNTASSDNESEMRTNKITPKTRKLNKYKWLNEKYSAFSFCFLNTIIYSPLNQTNLHDITS